MAAMTRTFEQSCEMAARKDDGKISVEEELILNRIKRACETFRKEIQSIK
jgi:hypothetical protein